MASDLDARRTLMLWAIIAKGGDVMQKDIKPEIRKADRDALTAAGLLETETADGLVRVRLTADGWTWAERNLTARLPTNSTAGTQVLQDVLIRLQAFLSSNGGTVQELITNQPFPKLAEPSHNSKAPTLAAEEPGSGVAGDGPGPGADSLRLFERLRITYLAITGGALNKRVRLKDLRERLSDLEPFVLDQALSAFALAGQGRLLAIERASAITSGDRDAAVVFENKPKHILKIDL